MKVGQSALAALPPQAYWVAFNKVAGIGPARLSALLGVCGSIEAAWKASIHQLQAANLDKRSQENLLLARQQLDLHEEWQRLQRAGVQVLTWDDEGYPTNLRETEAPPPVLYVRGQLQPEDMLAVALVGTRRASAYGREVAHLAATEFVHNNITVVSGLALGVDTVAHRAALDAGGRTIAVLGSGVDQVYPAQNRELGDAIMAQGALVSEYPLGTRPEANNFPPRNRIISGLSRAVVIIEANQRSGALITAEFAAEQGREVFAVPGSILHPGSAGCNELIRQGAAPFLSVSDVLDQLNFTTLHTQRMVRQSTPVDPLEAQLINILTQEACHIDELVRRMALPSSQISSLLTLLELKGFVRQVGGMTYIVRT
ncbi:MAG: DNA-processing protein DprA [Caldilineaceae bacterium]|nr:DNA-processing protein DprA [Caldilineaceae bacterium]